ncbi:hypothetical protein [Cryptosporidium hominis TU502]|uniref:hypothetical protein n=1 Tax=Cryptosporidium hominis (strain TU502) TaxID=353151 RepID=UPI0000452A30|nr:hypothetical protein [Cryptosporidium hominis TU502]
MRSILFCFILLFYPISTSLGKESELFWKMKTNLILTTDARFEGAQLCTSLEDELMENAEGSDIKYENDTLNCNLNSNNMIELVVTNSKKEEVTLFVTDAVYNLIYKKKDLRKNPSTFHRKKISESIDEYQNNNASQEVESTGRIVYIKKYYSPEGANKHLPVIQKFNYSNIQFSINSSSVSVSAMNTFNFTNSSGNE